MVLRRLLLTLIAASMLLCGPAWANDIGGGKRLGVGLGGGTTTSGLTAKYYLGKRSAVQVFLGQRFAYGNSIGADYILEFPTLAQGAPGRLFWGVGAGVGLLLYNRTGDTANVLGLSGVLQLGWHFRQFPLELIADWRPTLFVGDYAGGLWFGGGGGAVRWYF